MRSEIKTIYWDGKLDSVNDPVVFTTFLDFDEHMKNELPDIYKIPDNDLHHKAEVYQQRGAEQGSGVGGTNTIRICHLKGGDKDRPMSGRQAGDSCWFV